MQGQIRMRRSLERAPIHSAEHQVTNPSLLVWMVFAIFAVAAVAYWGEPREFASALADFAGEQHALAQAVALAVKTPLLHSESPHTSIVQKPTASTSEARTRLRSALKAEQFASAVRSGERPNQVEVLIKDPFEPGLTASDGRVVQSPTIEAGFRSNASWVRLGRSEAGALGLPSRTAMAGLTTLEHAGQQWGVVVLATAERERDREVLAQWRLVLSVVVASGLVVSFGGLALRTQRKQMALAYELEVASVQSKLDERLVLNVAARQGHHGTLACVELPSIAEYSDV